MSDVSASNAHVTVSITDQPLIPDDVAVSVLRDDFGAVVTFVGRVRNHDRDVEGDVLALEYTAHPDAETVMTEVVASFATEEVQIAAHHRIGKLYVGEAALVVSVASAHRTEVFDLVRDVVEQIKKQVPIWKKQLGSDGSEAWVGLS